VLDVREPDEYKAGHVLNAKSISARKLKESLSELEKYRDKPMWWCVAAAIVQGTPVRLWENKALLRHTIWRAA